MNISKANANKLGQLFAEALEHCNNPEQRAGVLKASDLIADEFSAKQSDASWKRYIAFREGFQQRFDDPLENTHFGEFTLPNGVRLQAYTRGDKAHFTGSSTGDHAVFFDGTLNRLAAHWEGYKSNALRAYERYVNRSPL